MVIIIVIIIIIIIIIIIWTVKKKLSMATAIELTSFTTAIKNSLSKARGVQVLPLVIK